MKLVIINGPCGVGKSTVAEAVHQALPLSLLVDIDSQRRLFSQYYEHYEESAPLAQASALAIAEAALKLGCDVIVDKMQYITDWYDQWVELGVKTKAETYQLVLWASEKTVLERADARGYKVGGKFTRDKAIEFWHKINEFKSTHPAVSVIDTEDKSPADVTKEVLEAIKG